MVEVFDKWAYVSCSRFSVKKCLSSQIRSVAKSASRPGCRRQSSEQGHQVDVDKSSSKEIEALRDSMHVVSKNHREVCGCP